MKLMKKKLRWLFLEIKKELPFLKKIPLPIWLLIFGSAIYAASKKEDAEKRTFQEKREGSFKTERILEIPDSAIYQGKETSFQRKTSDLAQGQTALTDKILNLEKSLDEIKTKLDGKIEEKRDQTGKPKENESGVTKAVSISLDGEASNNNESPENKRIDVSIAQKALSDAFEKNGNQPGNSGHIGNYYIDPPRRRTNRGVAGPAIVSFPVKGEGGATGYEVALPPGSYVRAKLLTGVEAPEGRTYPALLQLDFAFIGPNKKKIDLSGCFMIAKAEGDLSTERVQMQATKLSCVARDGKMFERDVNGFVADDIDNSFAVTGTVNTKQDRVALMAFLSSVVEGIGKAIQDAQVSHETNAFGGKESSVTGNREKYIAAGGASNAAGMVAEWYLKQAQNLLPTINIGSGRDMWIVMHETVGLPSSFFKRIQNGGKESEKNYSFVSRILD